MKLKRMNISRMLLLTTAFAFYVAVYAQPGRRIPVEVVSPQVNPDNTVVFRFVAPQAKEVKLSAQFERSAVPMTKDSLGVWSVTRGPVKPDMYPYCFIVDGISVADPNNTAIFANERFKNSLVDIPGDTPLIHSLQNVPHGKISYRYYNSKTLGATATRPLVVYTPPGFNVNGKTNYPVLYLIHGGSDTEETWTKVGKANLIIDNLIAQSQAKPMIIVMPYGNVRPKSMPEFTPDVMNDVIPFVEANYPALTDSRNRAIAGFSVGGGQTLNIGLTNTDKFAYVCAYAPYPETEKFRKNFANYAPDAEKMNKQLKLFTLSVGTEEFLFESVKKNIAMFKEKGLKPVAYIVDGGHTWMNCKQYLGRHDRSCLNNNYAFVIC